MSYNVTRWQTKELKDLRIPISSLFKNEREDWHPERTNHDDGSVEFKLMDDVYVHGAIVGDTLEVDEIEAQGEGSGYALHTIIEPALTESTGKLVASRVWEGGDSIDRLIVNDGVVRSERVEI